MEHCHMITVHGDNGDKQLYMALPGILVKSVIYSDLILLNYRFQLFQLESALSRIIPSSLLPLSFPALPYTVHYYAHGRNGDFVVQAPLVLGHEAAGVVTAVGPGVKNLVVGQRVAIEAGIMCNNCSYCSKGRYNLCKNMRFCSSAKTFPHADGTLQERMNHPAHVLHP